MCLNNSKMAAHMPLSRASLSHFLLLNFLDIGDSCLCAFWPLPIKIRLDSNRNATGWTPIEVYSDFSEFPRVAIKEAPSSLLKWICSPFFPEDCWNRFSESRNDNIVINESCCDCKNAYWNGVALRYLRLRVVSVFIWKRKFLYGRNFSPHVSDENDHWKRIFLKKALQSETFWKRCFRMHVWSRKNGTFQKRWRHTNGSNPLFAIL